MKKVAKNEQLTDDPIFYFYGGISPVDGVSIQVFGSYGTHR